MPAAVALAPLSPPRAVDEDRLQHEACTASFERTFAELADSPLRPADVVEIANAVYGKIKKNSSREAALAYIRRPHDACMNAKRGIDATGGRSAGQFNSRVCIGAPPRRGGGL